MISTCDYFRHVALAAHLARQLYELRMVDGPGTSNYHARCGVVGGDVVLQVLQNEGNQHKFNRSVQVQLFCNILEENLFGQASNVFLWAKDGVAKSRSLRV